MSHMHCLLVVHRLYKNPEYATDDMTVDDDGTLYHHDDRPCTNHDCISSFRHCGKKAPKDNIIYGHAWIHHC